MSQVDKISCTIGSLGFRFGIGCLIIPSTFSMTPVLETQTTCALHGWVNQQTNLWEHLNASLTTQLVLEMPTSNSLSKAPMFAMMTWNINKIALPSKTVLKALVLMLKVVFVVTAPLTRT